MVVRSRNSNPFETTRFGSSITAGLRPDVKDQSICLVTCRNVGLLISFSEFVPHPQALGIKAGPVFWPYGVMSYAGLVSLLLRNAASK